MEEGIQEAHKKNGLLSPAMAVGIVIIILLIAGGAFVFAKKLAHKAASHVSEESMEHMQVTPQVSPMTTVTPTATDAANVVTVNMEAGSFYFKPNEIRVKKGQTVKVVLHAVSMMHSFNIDAFNVKGTPTRNGTTSTVEFVADKTGTFQFYCGIGNHRQMGQVGTLIVE